MKNFTFYLENDGFSLFYLSVEKIEKSKKNKKNKKNEKMSKISLLVDPMSPKLIFCENTCFSRHFGIFTTLVATLLMIIETHELTLHRGPRPFLDF